MMKETIVVIVLTPCVMNHRQLCSVQTTEYHVLK